MLTHSKVSVPDGIVQEPIAAGSRGAIAVPGSIVKTLTGLIPYQKYYVDPSTLKLSLTSNAVLGEYGFSLSDTELFINMTTPLTDFYTNNIKKVQ